jgi:thioredoxin-like negative regulator of GroEL
MFEQVESFDAFAQLQEKEPALLAYFSTETCNVCKVLKPKVAELIQTAFPEIKMVYIQTDKLPEVAAQNQVFIVPTLLVYFGGREYIRKSRNIGIGELEREIARPYSMIFGE